MPACGWEVATCGDACEAILEGLSPEVRVSVEEWAIDRLWKWTNMRFGPCEVSYRPCRKKCYGYNVWGPALVNGNFINLTCGTCGGDDCSCRHVSEVILPGPISEPTQILIDGVELDLSAVRVDDWNKLVRIDGGHFPVCQDIGAPPDEDGTWQVTYLQGEPVPPGGDIVAGSLACEYAKAICGDSSCRLPKRVSAITRQGITMGMLDNFTNMKEGFTGIWEIDDWIMSAITPPARSVVFSPDIPRPRQTTWSYGDSTAYYGGGYS